MIILADFYELYAELSIAFAGFAGVVGAFSKFRVIPEAIALRVRFLVSVALTVLVGSILPPVLLALQVAEDVAIRVSAFFLATCIFLLAVYAWRELRPLQRAGLIHTQFVTAVLYAVGIPLVIALLAVAAGGFSSDAAAIYLAALTAGLASCCWYFIQLMFTVDIGGRE